MAGYNVFLLASLFLLMSTSALAQDNTAPFYLQAVYVYVVDENLEAGNEIPSPTSIQAFDLENDPVTYFIDPLSVNGNLFEVRTVFSESHNGNIGLLFFRNDSNTVLDREVLTPENEPLDVFVQASDGIDHGIAPVEANAKIYLRDLNDVSPVFSNLDASVPVNENTNDGTILYDVDATDADFGGNAQILYFISDELDLFEIDVSTGVINLNGSLDFDVMGGREHQITITAVDRGVDPLSAVGTLIVEVVDVDDLPPEFELPLYSIAVQENLTQGMSVIEVTAIDGDRGVNDDITYTIVSGNLEINDTESFGINMTTGVIFVNTPVLDREVHPMYTLTVEATEENNVNRRSTVPVTITVLDVNDNAPFFVEPTYMANVSEEADIGTTVLIVTAMDRDTGIHGQFTFRLEPFDENITLPFDITHDEGIGTIALAEELDFETTDIYNFMVSKTH
jgi:hypothetical protein